MKRLVILATFATAAAGGMLHAQTPASGNAAANTELSAALQSLRPGHLVRISASGVRDTGRVAVASPTQLAFRRRTGLEPVSASTIDSLWTWKSNAGSGALAGAIVVGGFGMLMGYAASGMALDYEPSGGQKFGAAVAVGVVGGLMGALIGGTIGSVLSHWTLVHPQSPRAP